MQYAPRVCTLVLFISLSFVTLLQPLDSRNILGPRAGYSRQLRSLAFSIYSRASSSIDLLKSGRSLTFFGPIADKKEASLPLSLSLVCLSVDVLNSVVSLLLCSYHDVFPQLQPPPPPLSLSFSVYLVFFHLSLSRTRRPTSWCMHHPSSSPPLPPSAARGPSMEASSIRFSLLLMKPSCSVGTVCLLTSAGCW